MEYNIKPNETGEEILMEDRTIEKRGHVIEFTLSDVDANIRQNTKTQTELAAKVKVDSAKQENIINFHPFLKNMSEEEIFTAWLYQDTQNTIDLVQSKLDEVEAQIESDTEEMKVIKEQLPELNNIESPYEPKEPGEDKE